MFCKQLLPGSLPGSSTNLFQASHLGEGDRPLTGEAGFETLAWSVTVV